MPQLLEPLDLVQLNVAMKVVVNPLNNQTQSLVLDFYSSIPAVRVVDFTAWTALGVSSALTPVELDPMKETDLSVTDFSSSHPLSTVPMKLAVKHWNNQTQLLVLDFCNSILTVPMVEFTVWIALDVNSASIPVELDPMKATDPSVTDSMVQLPSTLVTT